MSERPDYSQRELKEIKNSGVADYVASKEQPDKLRSPVAVPVTFSAGEDGLNAVEAAVKRAEYAPNGDSRLEKIEALVAKREKENRERRLAAGLPSELTVIEKIFGEAKNPQQLQAFKDEFKSW